MNKWTRISIDLANQKNYLDLLFKVYPTIPEDCRDIDNVLWNAIKKSYNEKDTKKLIENLLKLDLFPIKDSYVAYLKRDKNAIDRNPETVARLAGRVFDIGLNKLYERCSEPKETNRQIGPLFKQWVNRGVLGVFPVSKKEFFSNEENAVLHASDLEMKTIARDCFGYNRDKGLDFIARFNKKYIIGEAKFLTDFGGHQNAQFEDAISTLDSKSDAIHIAILDGVLYIPGKHKLYQQIIHRRKNNNIMSALVLREFLYQV